MHNPLGTCCVDVTGHDDVIKMEKISALLALCEENPPITGSFPLQRPGALIFPFIWAWIKNWANNRGAGDLRRHRTYYDVTVMVILHQNQM